KGDDPSRAGYYQPTSRGFQNGVDKVGNFWLTRGRHTIRLQRNYWTGFQAITAVSLRAADESVARSTRVSTVLRERSHRIGECGELEVLYGPRRNAGVLPVHWLNIESPTLRTSMVSLPATPTPQKMRLNIPCSAEGNFEFYFNGGPEKIDNRDISPISYEVIDTRQAPGAARELQRELVLEVDCAQTAPDYAAGDTQVVRRPAGVYRESGDNGWLDYQSARAKLGEPSWFAYTLKGLQKQQPYMVEIDYPDDAERTFAIAIRGADPLSYPVAGGVDSGGVYKLSQKMQTQTLLFWPRATDPRIVFMPARNGGRAVAAKIRVYRVQGKALPPLLSVSQPGRRYINWYEEGSNFLSMYGAPGDNALGSRIALERWAQAVSYMGGNELWPTVVIYSFALYPSVYNKSFSRPWSHDLMRQLLLVAEKHRMKVVPELHPRADELAWPYVTAPEPKPELLASRAGQNHKDLPPFYNPLHPGNQNWYVGMVGELVDRYRDSPALAGVSLRLMQWKNPALHNFHSLDWGYDDLTISMFEKETGIRIPVEASDPRRYNGRHRWLMMHARERWIEWRCAKIAALVTRIRDRVRRARPDLVVHIPVFSMTEAGSTYNAGTAWMREAGFDPQRLAKIDGVMLVNAYYGYGRRSDAATNTLLHNHLTNPSVLQALSVPGKPSGFLPNANYFEATEAIVLPEKLGFPPTTRKTWMGAVVNPSGRNYLERYALLLAQTDTPLLGDGGNTYTLGQPELREFLNEYRRLPAVPFTPRRDARDPVAVWELEREGEYWFYAVNKTASAVKLTLSFEGSGALTPVSGKAAVPVSGHKLDVSLQPFQLRAYRTRGPLRIQSVGVD
ncbi:MAG TPA: family 10 glycosylhydrolase, partial [Burkholderiales bacterium]